MAVTSPDNIRTPNDGDGYALIQDLGVMASSMQAALVLRANLYRGTVAQRQAFTTAPIGVHWQDTNGSNMWEFVMKSGGWVVVNPSASGIVTTANLPPTTTVNTAVSFPSGLFAVAPQVILQNTAAPAAARNVVLRPTSVTASGFNIAAYNYDTSSYVANVSWVAVQGT